LNAQLVSVAIGFKLALFTGFGFFSIQLTLQNAVLLTGANQDKVQFKSAIHAFNIAYGCGRNWVLSDE
jgi:hypothetical protein